MKRCRGIRVLLSKDERRNLDLESGPTWAYVPFEGNGHTYGDQPEAPGTTFPIFPKHAHSPESLSPHLSEVRGDYGPQELR